MRSGIDTDFVLGSVRAQDDLFRHVNGRWLDEVPIPDDRGSHGTFHLLRDAAEEQLRTIVESAARGELAGDEARKVGDLYASFMDEDRIEELGVSPIAADLALVDAVEDLPGLIRTFGELDRSGSGAPFGFYVNGDAKQSDRYIAYINQGGLSLPDEAYYRDEQYAPIREAFVDHVAKMLVLAERPDPAGAAERILALETRLAAHHWDRVSTRDATRSYNRLDAAQLAELAPAFDWRLWASALGAPLDALFEAVVVRQPEYFTGLSEVLATAPLQDWKDWLAWRQISGAAPLLSTAFVQQNFDFYGRTLTGTPQLRDRWKRALGMVEGALGEALGSLYVERHFSAGAKERMQELVANLVEAYRRSITRLDWMGEDTRARALAKLEAFTPKIGYPDSWRDYSALEISRGDLIGNARRAAEFELARDFAKIGGPVDRSEWFMTPQTVNAYYNPLMNEIVFPAAILQKPFFDAEADDAVNYGAIGAVIGHEIGHGFDDQGSKYDGQGNLVDWWTDADRGEFEKRTTRLVAQYAVLEPRQAPGHVVNGELTVGENIGDLGGLSIAHAAYLISLQGAEAPELDGMTGEQRFFWAWAQAWRSKSRDEELVRRLALDPHSPEEFRCNAVVRNIDAFHAAFGVTEADALWLAEQDRVRIW